MTTCSARKLQIEAFDHHRQPKRDDKGIDMVRIPDRPIGQKLDQHAEDHTHDQRNGDGQRQWQPLLRDQKKGQIAPEHGHRTMREMGDAQNAEHDCQAERDQDIDAPDRQTVYDLL